MASKFNKSKARRRKASKPELLEGVHSFSVCEYTEGELKGQFAVVQTCYTHDTVGRCLKRDLLSCDCERWEDRADQPMIQVNLRSYSTFDLAIAHSESLNEGLLVNPDGTLRGPLPALARREATLSAPLPGTVPRPHDYTNIAPKPPEGPPEDYQAFLDRIEPDVPF